MPLAQNPNITFVLANAGQVKAMAPVMRSLESQGTDYCVLAEGTARKLLTGDPHLASIAEAEDSDVLVTGLSDRFQQQWATGFAQLGRPVIGIYDDFRVNPMLRPLQGFLQSLTAVLTPSYAVAQALQAQGPNIPMLPLGQPALETIGQRMQTTNPAQLAQVLRLDLTRPTVLYLGDNASTHDEALGLLAATARQTPSVQYVISLHPASDGQHEQQTLRIHGWPSNIQITPKTLDSASLLALPGPVLAHQSNLGLMAQILGKPVVYLGTLGNPFQESPNVTAGFAQRGNTPSDVLQLLAQSSPVVGLQAALGIPAHPTEAITNFLKTLINNAEYPEVLSHQVSALPDNFVHSDNYEYRLSTAA